jgi:hypothetical protein
MLRPAIRSAGLSFDIFGKDNEFAVSTGANVNSGVGTSGFDDPPSASIGLVITTHDSDASPRQFELGDSYDLSWSGPGGDGRIVGATVVRSDPAQDGAGIIVFEGLLNGATAQVIWTPDFDVNAWYYANFNGSVPPVFSNSDQDPAYTHGYICFAAETLLSSPYGPIRAIDVAPGDVLDTLDHGPQAVRWAGQATMAGIGAATPVRIGAGRLGPVTGLRLSGDHRVLVRSHRAELMFGACDVLVPAKALVNGRDIRAEPCGAITYVHLLFDRHELLLAGGIACESLFLGEVAEETLAEAAPDSRLREAIRRGGRMVPARPILTVQEGRVLLADPSVRAVPEWQG